MAQNSDVAALLAEVAVLRADFAIMESIVAHLLADAAWRARPKPLPPLSATDLTMLQEVVGLVEPGVRFQVGDLTDDVDRAGRYGRVLGKAAQRGAVGRYRVEKLPKHAGRAVWVIHNTE